MEGNFLKPLTNALEGYKVGELNEDQLWGMCGISRNLHLIALGEELTEKIGDDLKEEGKPENPYYRESPPENVSAVVESFIGTCQELIEAK